MSASHSGPIKPVSGGTTQAWNENSPEFICMKILHKKQICKIKLNSTVVEAFRENGLIPAIYFKMQEK